MVFDPSLDIVFFRSGFSLVRGLASSLDLGISIGEFVFCVFCFSCKNANDVTLYDQSFNWLIYFCVTPRNCLFVSVKYVQI